MSYGTRGRSRPRTRALDSHEEFSSSISKDFVPAFSQHSTSDSSESASTTSLSSHESVSTIISPSLGADVTQLLEPLPATPPRAKPTIPTQVEHLKKLADEAKATGIDPSILMIAQLMNSQATAQPDPSVVSAPRSKPFCDLKQGEDIFVFLHRFEFQMKSKHIHPNTWLQHLPDLLHGDFSEAFYNNITSVTTFAEMRTILLNAGGYSFNDCLQSFPLKFRASGSKSPMQWFNHWCYKFGVILDHLTFLSDLTDAQIELMSQSFAIIGVLAGMQPDARESVLNRQHHSIHSFLQDCSSLFSVAESKNKYHPSNAHSNSYHSNPQFSNPHHSNPYNSNPYHSNASQSSYRSYPSRHGNYHTQHNNHFKPHSNYSPNHPASYQPNHSHPNSSHKRDISTVTCFKCNTLGHYANTCTAPPTQSLPPPRQPQPQTTPTSSSNTSVTPTRPTPVPRSNPRSVRKVDILCSVSTFVDDITPLNHFDEEFITHGYINNIYTPIIVDSGAKRSLVSPNFITSDLSPVMNESVCGISRVVSQFPVYELPIDVPTLKGVARFAACPTLPDNTVLLGIDFGQDKFLELINSIKQTPATVHAVTRAMSADDQLAQQVTEALHVSEGGNPLPLDDIPEFVSDMDDAVPDSDVIPVEQHSDISTVEPSHNTSSSNDSQNDLVPHSLPTLTFDGLTRDQFRELQLSDESLAPLWEHAHNNEKQFFVVNGLLMCITSTMNTVSNALVVPMDLRRNVLLAAHDGLGHGGINVTRSLINRHFTWPNMIHDIRTYIQACPKCIKFSKSKANKVPMIEPELISERGEKIAIDIVGPLPKAKGNLRFIFTCLELASGYPFAIALKNYTAEATAQALLSVISVLGVPLEVLSDQGSNFLSTTMNHLCKRFRIHKIRTSPYHPQSNGRLERFHSTLKCMLSKAIDEM